MKAEDIRRAAKLHESLLLLVGLIDRAKKFGQDAITIFDVDGWKIGFESGTARAMFSTAEKLLQAQLVELGVEGFIGWHDPDFDEVDEAPSDAATRERGVPTLGDIEEHILAVVGHTSSGRERCAQILARLRDAGALRFGPPRTA